jgi:SIR2-like domain
MDSKVYILGAGCSVEAGYPDAKRMVEDLKLFRDSELKDEGTTRLKRCITDTIELMLNLGADTIDELADRVHKGALRKFGDPQDLNVLTRDHPRWNAIWHSKSAIAAMFLHREQSAKSKLQSYKRFLYRIFGGGGTWRQAIEKTACHVLTFNYDRLFEIAFRQHFPDVPMDDLYSPIVLNSGINLLRNKQIDFAEGRFSFVKLHGSVGMLAQNDYDEPAHSFQALPFDQSKVTDETFFPSSKDGRSRPETLQLIVFPNEKEFVMAGGETGFTYRNYIPRVWEWADKLLSQASKIEIIGYSFHPIDHEYLLPRLRKAVLCKEIIVRDKNAIEVCKDFECQHSEFKGLLTPLQKLF